MNRMSELKGEIRRLEAKLQKQAKTNRAVRQAGSRKARLLSEIDRLERLASNELANPHDNKEYLSPEHDNDGDATIAEYMDEDCDCGDPDCLGCEGIDDIDDIDDMEYMEYMDEDDMDDMDDIDDMEYMDDMDDMDYTNASDDDRGGVEEEINQDYLDDVVETRNEGNQVTDPSMLETAPTGHSPNNHYASKLKQASARLDRLAGYVEKQGNSRLAFKIDKIADAVDQKLANLNEGE